MTATQVVHDVLVMLVMAGSALGGVALGAYFSRRP